MLPAIPATAGAQVPGETPPEQDPAAVAAQVAQLTGRWQAVFADIAAAEPELIAAEDALTSAERRAGDSQADLAGLRVEEEHARLAHAAAIERADAAAHRLSWTVRQLDLADLSLSQQEDLIVDHAVLVYKHGSTLRLGVVDSLLRSQSSSELVTNLALLERVGDHERAILQGLQVKRARVDELQGQAESAWTVAATELAAARRASEVLGELTVEQESTARGANGQRQAALAAASSARGKVAALQAERAALEQQLAALGVTPVAPSEAAPIPDRVPRRTSWPRPRRFPPVLGYRCPVAGATFINDWGFPRPGGRTHEGTDVFARRGTPIRAVADGTVTNVD
ncbi:MAG TPA: hypothetical protein VHF25_01700, partial [Nitriliruptorales bacterium]|nr:hypothetical protein [Nitriliruptorales bacterium]